jgi:thiol-disulfide isomerase/thioredoxin
MDKLSNLKKTISSNIISSINDIKSKPESLILPIFIILLFSIISYILFSKNIKEFINKKFVLNKEFVNKDTDNNNNATIIYFYTEWCPYCKKWNSFKDLVDLQSFKETLTLKEVDCDKNPEIADNYKIDGYPTIKLIYNGEVYDYDAKPESKTLLQFVESIISQN